MDKLERRLLGMEKGATPMVPVVDYLEAIGVAFDCHQQGDYEEAAAILQDVLDDTVFREEFPIPEIWYVLGDCYKNLGMPRYAEDCFGEALRLDPDYTEARSALENLYE
jgi:tetratricopeptide (TPR) repeat protein